MEREAKIYVCGHTGLLGKALVRRLNDHGYRNLLLKTRRDLDLTIQADVWAAFERDRPDYVFLTAGLVGGIRANNTLPASFIYQNLAIQTNVIDAAYRAKTKRILFLGSSCIYPRDAAQPIREEYLLSGPLEETNRPYAVAKISGLEMCSAYNRQYGTDFRSVMPTNLYGPGDRYDLEHSHVIPALMLKMHEAKLKRAQSITVWGTGSALREFLYCDDLADACILVMQQPQEKLRAVQGEAPTINVGCGEDLSIRDLVMLMREVVGFEGEILWDRTHPDGTPKKRLDISRIRALGWAPTVGLREGLVATYRALILGLQGCP